MTFWTCVRARTSCSDVSFSKSTRFRRSRCNEVFKSWYDLSAPPLAPDGVCGIDGDGNAICYPLLKSPSMPDGAGLEAKALSCAEFFGAVKLRAHSLIADPKSDLLSEVIGEPELIALITSA